MNNRKQVRKSDFLGTEPIKKLITKLSIPAIIGMIFNALYNLVDTIFVGRFVGVDAIGGLAIAFPIQMLMVGIGIMIGVGSASAVSRALGRGDIQRADNVAGNGVIAIFVISLIFTVFGSIYLVPILKLFGATENILPYAFEYVKIILFGAIFIIGTITTNNLVRAEGNAKIAMITMMIGTILNIILDPIFIKVLDMGISGAAYATVLSRMISFIFAISYFYVGKSSLAIKFVHLKPKLSLMKEIFSVGFPTLTRNIGTSVLAVALNNSLSYFGGDLSISVYGIINKLMMFSLMPMFGLSQAFQPIAGYNFGARKFERLKESIYESTKRFLIYGFGITIMVLIFSEQLVRLFTTDVDLIAQGTFATRIIFIGVPIIGIQIMASILFQALGKAKPAFFISVLRQILLLVPLILIVPHLFDLGLTGIWLSFPISDFLAVAISGILLRKEIIKINREIKLSRTDKM